MTTSGPTEDRDAILHVHSEWWEANREVDVPRMQACFVPGDERYVMFNLNGHPYWGMTEKTKLWEALHAFGLRIPDIEQPVNLRLDIHGGLAWLCHEAVIRLEAPEPMPGLPTDPMRVRSTEIYERTDDGWRIVHFHCSPHAPDDEERVPFGDTVETRPERA